MKMTTKKIWIRGRRGGYREPLVKTAVAGGDIRLGMLGDHRRKGWVTRKGGYGEKTAELKSEYDSEIDQRSELESLERIPDQIFLLILLSKSS